MRRRRLDEDEDEDRAAKRPAYGSFSPIKTRAQSRKRDAESSVQTRSRSRAHDNPPVIFELPARTRRKRTVASTSGRSLAEPVASTSGESLAELLDMPITTDYGATSSRAVAPIFNIRVPPRRHTYDPLLATASSSSVLSLLPSAGVVDNWASSRRQPNYGALLTAPSRRLSTQPTVDKWSYPQYLRNSRPVPDEDERFIKQTRKGKQFITTLAQLDEGDDNVDPDCLTCFEPIRGGGKRLACPPCGHLLHDKCLRGYHDAMIKNGENAIPVPYEVDRNNLPCPSCMQAVRRVADIRNTTNFEMLRYPFDMRYDPPQDE